MRGRTLRVVDEFSPWFVGRPKEQFDAFMARGYKGTEIDTEDGGVDDSRLRRGLSQLQHALPALLAERIRTAAVQHPADNAPFVLAPILVTNAPLVLAHRRLSMRHVERVDTVAELGDEVPFLSVHVATGPAFEQHVATQARELPKYLGERGLVNAEESRKTAGHPEYGLPATLIATLVNGITPFPLRHPFNQVIVCQANNLNELVTAIKAEAVKVNRSIQRERPKWGYRAKRAG
jgi:hypothetical protein